MRLVEALQIAAAVIGALASAFMAVEQRLVKRFRRRGATSSKAAVQMPRVRLVTRWRLSRLRSAGAVVVLEDGSAYMNEEVYSGLRKRRAILGVSLVVLAIAVVILVHAAVQ